MATPTEPSVDCPTEAGVPRTKSTARGYETDEIRVLWDATRCIHTAICLRTLPDVFDVDARPWIDVTGADAEAIAATVRKCPTGALRYDGPGVGADLGPRAQDRPDGMPRAVGIVLPVIENDHAVYAQIRVPHPQPDRPRYLNPTSDLATNPRLARVRPVETRHSQVVVTEGAIDALSAAAAGYRSVAVLSAAYGDEAVATALAKLPHPLVIAFDADDAGRAGAHRLASLLDARQRPPLVVDLGHGDLNDAMRRSDAWPKQMTQIVDHAVERPSATGVSVSR